MSFCHLHSQTLLFQLFLTLVQMSLWSRDLTHQQEWSPRNWWMQDNKDPCRSTEPQDISSKYMTWDYRTLIKRHDNDNMLNLTSISIPFSPLEIKLNYIKRQMECFIHYNLLCLPGGVDSKKFYAMEDMFPIQVKFKNLSMSLDAKSEWREIAKLLISYHIECISESRCP